MTWKQMYEKERSRWFKQVLIIDFVHCIKLYNNPKWRIIDTANYFAISKSLCCENLLLAAAIKQNSQLEHNSRNTALKAIRQAYKQANHVIQAQPAN